ncbi:hypothetical protein Lepto7375DRAFT_1105, partial [Leptolyngbya sp. PCC 7375]
YLSRWTLISRLKVGGAEVDIVVTPKIRTGLRERKLESNRGKEYGQQAKKLQ